MSRQFFFLLTDNYPVLAGRAVLYPGEGGSPVLFHCDLEDGPIPVGADLEVDWFIEGKS